MQTTVETTEPHTVKLTIEVAADEYAPDLDAAYKSIANQVKIPGFRKGKIPRTIIDAQIGADVVRDEFIHSAVPSYYRQAIADEDLAPITDPEIDLEAFTDVTAPLIFTAVVEVRPRLELTQDDYFGVKVSRPAVEVSEADIDDWIDRLRERFSELEPAERPVREGDFATIDVKGTASGEDIDGLVRTDYLYFVGSGEFGPSLDAELIGAKPGDILNVSETMNEGAGEMAGRTADIQVLVKDVKARILPEADDAFATTASEFDTIEQLRDDLRTRLGELKEREAQGVVRDRVISALVDAVEVDLPDTLIDDETEHRVHLATERAERAGMTLEQLLEAQGWDEDRLREDSRDHAIRAIKSDLVLESVARSEELEVTADEIGAEISQLAQAYDREPKELATQLERSGQIVTLAGDIIRGKALDLLVERADIDTESPEADEPADQVGDAPAEEAPDEKEPE